MSQPIIPTRDASHVQFCHRSAYTARPQCLRPPSPSRNGDRPVVTDATPAKSRRTHTDPFTSLRTPKWLSHSRGHLKNSTDDSDPVARGLDAGPTMDGAISSPHAALPQRQTFGNAVSSIGIPATFSRRICRLASVLNLVIPLTTDPSIWGRLRGRKKPLDSHPSVGYTPRVERRSDPRTGGLSRRPGRHQASPASMRRDGWLRQPQGAESGTRHSACSEDVALPTDLEREFEGDPWLDTL